MLSVFAIILWCSALVQAIPAPTAVATPTHPKFRLPPTHTIYSSGSRITHAPTGWNGTNTATGGRSGGVLNSGVGWNATRASNSSQITRSPTPSGVSIMTDPEFGVVIGCTKPITITSPFLYYTKGQAACNGGYTISTVSSIWESYEKKMQPTTYAWETITAPKSGCSTITMSNSQDSFCTCAGGIIAGLIEAVATTGPSKGHATTVCEAVPTGYVSVPIVSPKSPKYLQAPSANCADGSITHTSCWNDLDLGDYVNWWWTTFSKHCQGLPFADCFYAISTPYSPSNCTQLNVQAECKQPSWSDFESNWNGIRNFYVAQNIWNFNSFFVNYWIAIGQAESTATNMLGNLIKTINPVAKTNVALNDVLAALSFGLGMLPGPSGAIGKAFLAGANQAIGINKFLFPEGTLGSQTEDWDSISGQIAGLTQQLQASVTNALSGIQGEPANFLPFANTGEFSSGLPALNDLKDQILMGFTTYMVSQAYQTKGIFITRTIDTDVHALQTNGTKLNWDTGCGKGYDQYGTCDTFWYDSGSRITYALTDGESMTHNFNSEMQTFFFNYTTPELLFAGADACAQASKSTQGSGPNISVDPKNGVNAACLSNLKVCTWNLKPMENQGTDTPLLDCTVRDVIPRWGISGCIGGDGFGDVDVPRQYLGWGIIDDDVTNNIDMSFCDNIDV